MSSLANVVLYKFYLITVISDSYATTVPLKSVINVSEPNRTIRTDYVANIRKLEMQLQFNSTSEESKKKKKN